MLSSEIVNKIIDDMLVKKLSSEALEDKYHPTDIAYSIDHIVETKEKLLAFRRLDYDFAAEVLPLLSDQGKEFVVTEATAEQLGHIIGEMESDDAADILSDVDDEKAENVLDVLSDEVDEEVTRLMEYDKESAGGIMQTELIAVHEDTNIMKTIELYREMAEQIGEVHNIFIVDADKRLVGVLPVTQLLLNPPGAVIKETVEETPTIHARLKDDQEHVAELFKRYDLVSLPVVDEQMKLVGRILFDDIMDVIEEEADEDMMKMVGADDEALVQTHTSMKMVRYRLPWLSASLVGGLVTGWLIWQFKIALSEFLALAAFIPVVMGMSGNVGTQSSALVIRGLATGRINIDSLRQYIEKELIVGMILGLVCGAVAGIVAEIWHGDVWLGIVVAASIFLSIAVAAFLGTIIPLLFRFVKIDPAIAGGPIVLALNDITGLVIFFLIATVLLRL
ncbi:MAG TPA: magnesium transporter [Nitrospinota bacterium]|nr:magnesium transporter [Nitrospinota bacterium]|tara:strand:+ start:15426 stop:16772 length:1347 start_codon:yes stop_codon:yes gene_type:complete